MPGFLCRSPDARLQKAQALAKSWREQTSLSWYDPQVVEYARFVYELSQLNGIEQERHAARNEVLAQVHYLAGASAGADVFKLISPHEVLAAQRDMSLVKAMILCDVNHETIARDMGFLTEAIERFEYMVFDVRSHLQDRGYIHNHVLNNSALGNISSNDFEQLVLIEAYENGADGVRSYIGLDRRGEKTLEELRDQKNLGLEIKAKTSVRALKINSVNAIEIIRLSAQVEKDQRDLAIKREALKPQGKSGSNLSDKEQKDLVDQITGIGLSVANVDVESDESQNSPVEERALITFEAELTKELKRRREEAQDERKVNV